MKIVSWHCNGFNIEKYNELLRYKPMILLIQGCTKNEFDIVKMDIDKERKVFFHNVDEAVKALLDGIPLKTDSNNTTFQNRPPSIIMEEKFHINKFQHWYGDNVEENDKGTAIFSPTNLYNIELVDNYNNEFRYVIPYNISFIKTESQVGLEFFENVEYILLSIWLKPTSDRSLNYQNDLFDALDYYNFDKPIILVGDFNTGSNKNEIHRYEELNKKLEKYGLKNCAEKTEFEYEATCFHDKAQDYYINDFCFIPNDFTVHKVFIDKMDAKKTEQKFSCHYPIVVDFSGLAENLFEKKIGH